MLQTLLSARENTSWGMASHAADPALAPIDSNGNLTSKTEGSDTWAYQWNAQNQLLRVLKNSVEQASFAYDPVGRRVEKVAGGVTTTYTYGSEDILREVRGATTLEYVHGLGIDAPLASEDGSGALTYYHADGLGSIVKRTSQAGAVIHEYRYDAWGNIEIGASEPGYSFTGREWDPETKLYDYRNRYYDPGSARFIGEDPVRMNGGINYYAYVGGNPTNWVDPSGLCRIELRSTGFGQNFSGPAHTFIVMVDSGATSYWRGGPTNNAGTPSLPSGSGGSCSRCSRGASGSPNSNSSNSSSPGAGPGGPGQNNGPYGPVHVSYGPYLPGTPDWTSDPLPTTVVLWDNTPCDCYNRCLETMMNVMNNMQVPYNPITVNSNTAASTALRACIGGNAAPPLSSPGWGGRFK